MGWKLAFVVFAAVAVALLWSRIQQLVSKLHDQALFLGEEAVELLPEHYQDKLRGQ